MTQPQGKTSKLSKTKKKLNPPPASLVDRVRRRAIRDGALELASAIATLNQTVQVDLTQTPFQTNPANLFDLRFADLGMDEAQMALLRNALTRLLPEINQELAVNARVLDQSGHRVGDYAAFLRVALLLKVH